MIALGLLLAIQPASGPAPDPLAPSREGQVQCFRPDHARKTCRSIAAYSPTGPGTYLARAMGMVDDSSGAMIEAQADVHIVSGAICHTYQAEDLTRARLTRAGSPLSAEEAAPIVARLAASVEWALGQEICTRLAPMASGLVAVSLEGGVAPDQVAQYVSWISPNDGYRVAP